MPQSRPTLRSTTAVAIIAVSLVWTWIRVGQLPSGEAAVSGLVAAYESVRPMVGTNARIGFVAAKPESQGNANPHFVAQFALAPSILDTTLAGVSVVITGPEAPAAMDADPRLKQFELVAVAAAGVRVYQRGP